MAPMVSASHGPLACEVAEALAAWVERSMAMLVS